MRIIFSGGGTGGHIYPAITILQEVCRRFPTAKILYVGTKEGLEADIIPKEILPNGEKIDFATVKIAGFERKLTPKNLVRLFEAGVGVCQAWKIVKNFQPDVCVGTGGYVSGPVLLAASLQNIPAIVQEQNVLAGITNKILGKFVSKLALGYADAKKYFDEKKCVVTGNPIRQEILLAKREDGIREFHLDENKKTILISGGSRGARSLNRAMIGVLKKYANDERVQFIHVTGKVGYDEVKRNLQEIFPCKNVFVFPYVYKMPKALACADLAIFRAGAIGIAELLARHIPSLLVPYPFASENHQEMNARMIEKAGAARVILDKDLTAEILIKHIEEFLHDETILKNMSDACEKIAKPNATRDIVDLIFALSNQKEG